MATGGIFIGYVRQGAIKQAGTNHLKQIRLCIATFQQRIFILRTDIFLMVSLKQLVVSNVTAFSSEAIFLVMCDPSMNELRVT